MIDQTDFNALAQKAIKQVRALARGNGASADAIQIKNVDGEIIKCDAITHLEIHPEITEEQKKGRVQAGQVLPDAVALEKIIRETTTNAIKNTDVRKMMATLLLQRPDKGFAIHGEYFDLPPLKKTYSTFQSCKSCGGNGHTACQKCHGQRQEVCNKCIGRGMTPCIYCHSTGYQQGPNGEQQRCTRCHGQKQIMCPLCQKRGRIPCRQCKATGTITCNSCKGMGAFTLITHVDCKMKTLFEIDRAALPPSVTHVIENQGSKIVSRQEIKLQAEQVKREDGGLALQYDFEFPYALILMSINGKPYKMEIFGNNGRIIKLPAILETLIGIPLSLLEEAARGSPKTSSQVSKASKTRIIGDALTAVLSMPPKKALYALKKKYPIGISNEGIKNLVQTSQRAIKTLTAKARYSAYAIAGLFNAALNAAYFYAGLRPSLETSLGSSSMMIVDLSLIPLGGFIGSLVTKFIAQRPLKQALGHLLAHPKIRKMGVLPNYAISLMIFIIGLLIMKMIGDPLPAWISF